VRYFMAVSDNMRDKRNVAPLTIRNKVPLSKPGGARPSSTAAEAAGVAH
jgi:hypothetical protein